MAVEDQQQRRHLQEAMVEHIGSGPTDTLMDYLPPVGWADVATKQDLNTLQTVLHAEINELRSDLQAEFRGEIGALRGEIGTLHGEIGTLRGEIGSLSGEIGTLHGEIGTLHGEIGGLRGDLHRELRIQFYWTATLFMVVMTGFVAALKLT